MIKISKELFFEVRNYKEFNFNYTYNVATQELTRGAEVVYFICKEWAFKNGFEIVVLAHMIRIYRNGYEVYNTNTTLFDLDMFFKACEWVQQQKC